MIGAPEGNIEYRKPAGSPYLEPNRLEKVLALIQILGTHLDDDMSLDSLANTSTYDGGEILAVLTSHPEFFGCDDNKYYHLIMRRTSALNVSKETGEEISKEEISKIRPEQKFVELRLSRLTADQVGGLMKTAIDLHARALAAEEYKWWSAKLFIPFLGALLGSSLSQIFKDNVPEPQAPCPLNTNSSSYEGQQGSSTSSPSVQRGQQESKPQRLQASPAASEQLQLPSVLRSDPSVAPSQ